MATTSASLESAANELDKEIILQVASINEAAQQLDANVKAIVKQCIDAIVRIKHDAMQTLLKDMSRRDIEGNNALQKRVNILEETKSELQKLQATVTSMIEGDSPDSTK